MNAGSGRRGPASAAASVAAAAAPSAAASASLAGGGSDALGGALDGLGGGLGGAAAAFEEEALDQPRDDRDADQHQVGQDALQEGRRRRLLDGGGVVGGGHLGAVGGVGVGRGLVLVVVRAGILQTPPGQSSVSSSPPSPPRSRSGRSVRRRGTQRRECGARSEPAATARSARSTHRIA